MFHFDCFWMREFHWCDFTWDNRTFPDPAGMLSRLKDKGLRICVWINPYIAQRSPLFAEGAKGATCSENPTAMSGRRQVAGRAWESSTSPILARASGMQRLAGPVGPGRGLLQDRLRGADSYRRRVV